MSLILNYARPEAAYELQLAPEDALEVEHSGGRERLAQALAALPWALEARTEAGELVALGGVVQAGTQYGPWLLVSDGIKPHGLELWRRCKAAVGVLRQRASEGYTVAHHVGKQSAQHRRFLEKLGFVIESGPSDHFDPFHLPR